MRRLASVAALVVVAAAGFACGGDDDELTADERRYCELTAEVEAKGEEAFADLGEDASEDETAAAQKAFIDDVEDELDEMVKVAPEEIAEDVKAYNAFVKAQMRGEETEEASDEAILEWEEENCPA